MELYKYLEDKYGRNNPILLSEIEIDSMNDDAIRQSILRLEKKGIIKKYATGVYYLPKKTITDQTYLSFETVIERKYLTDGEYVFGFFSGLYLKNRFNLTTQVPNDLEIVTNKTAANKRYVTLAGREIILKKPRAMIDKENVSILEFLELLNMLTLYEVITNLDILASYVIQTEFTRQQLTKYLKYYPRKVAKNLVESELIYVFTSK